MKYGRIIVALGALSLGACSSNTVKDTLGLDRSAPDEFRVISRPPLSVPPQFTLRPPSNSDTSPSQASASQQAQSLMVNGKPADGSVAADTAVAPVSSKNLGKNKAAADKTSSAESQFLKNAGADKADPKVRDALVEDQFAKQAKQEECSWWDVTCITPEKKDPLVDAKKESDRIVKNENEGKSVDGKDAAVTKDRDTGVLGRIFGY